MNVFSLFSGIGGLELGLERAGMTVVGQVEIDPYCRRVLAKHWPEVPRHDDVRTCVDWWRAGGDSRPVVDLVCGGFPCQPVSVAGQRLGQQDERWLWPAFAAVVRDLRPRYVLVENVPGLLGRGMGDVLGDLALLGYDAEWDRVSAADLGAPHLRQRIIIVAYPQGRGYQDESKGVRSRIAVGTINRPGDRTAGGHPTPGTKESARRASVVAADVADTDGFGRGQGPRELGRLGIEKRSAAMADADIIRRNGRPRIFRSRWWRQPQNSDWWSSESDVGRVAHGIPRRVDRLRALGNAVVPQVAEHVGRLILAADAEAGAA